jgi:hypothetical protein
MPRVVKQIAVVVKDVEKAIIFCSPFIYDGQPAPTHLQVDHQKQMLPLRVQKIRQRMNCIEPFSS